MVKMLTKHGNSLALVIERSILELLHITPKTPLNISTDGQLLIIAPVKEKKRRKNFEEALAKTNEKYGRMLNRLAE